MSQLHLNKTKYNLAKYFALSSFGVIFLLSVTFLQPFSFTDNSYAETATENSSLDMSVTLDPTITIWTTDTSNNASSQVNIAANPDESIATGSIRAHVSTNNLTGYTLSIQSSSTDAKMTHEDNSITKTINPITGNGTSSTTWAGNSSLNNMWGYSLGNNDSYTAVPGSSSTAATIDETDAPNNDNYTDVTFAAKADLSLPAGTYTDTVVFSAVANAVPTPFVDNTYMQDYAGTNACELSESWDETGKEYTLIDSRDNISYKVRKLKDGHCWMAQNFRMTADTLSAAGHSATLDSSDTDILSSTSPSTFEMPDNVSWSGAASTGHLLKGAADASVLPKGSKTGSKATGEEAIAHGAYYSWCTATADCTNDVSTGIKQNNSICPKGWRLANPNNGSSTNDNEYYKVYNAYGTAASFNQAFNTYYSNGASYYLAGLWSANSSLQYVNSAGSLGYWWSSTSHSSNANNAWNLYADTSNVYPTDYGYRYSGYSVRCMF